MNNILKQFNLFVVLRCVVALIFIVSGVEKLLSPIENFIYALQSYEIIPFYELERAIAWIFPWIELVVGVFLLLGLWTKRVIFGVGFLACGFIFFVGQGILRRLPLLDCGCFGDLVHFPIWVTFALDWIILGIAVLLWRNRDRAEMLSLDRALD